MKWIFLVVIALVLLVIFRRLNREQRITTGEPTPTPTPGGGDFDQWSQRGAMSFDDFYNRYYASVNLDREYIRKTLEFISRTGGVPTDKIRPDDRIDGFPNKKLARMVGFVERILSGPLGHVAEKQGLDPAKFHLVTVDDIMRHLEVHKDVVAGHLHNEGEPPKEDAQWR
jgi:hypothetical protein